MLHKILHHTCAWVQPVCLIVLKQHTDLIVRVKYQGKVMETDNVASFLLDNSLQSELLQTIYVQNTATTHRLFLTTTVQGFFKGHFPSIHTQSFKSADNSEHLHIWS